MTVKKGQTVRFGTYWQGASKLEGKQPIEWLVLKVEGSRALLLSSKALECLPYNKTRGPVTWEECSLRAWLNGAFFKQAFDEFEQSCIVPTELQNPDNPTYGTPGGNPTVDQVFLLSCSEAQNAFDTCRKRMVGATEWCISHGAWQYLNDCYQWLRSPGLGPHLATYIHYGGSVNLYGFGVEVDRNAVRPALWVDFSQEARP